MRPSKPLLLLFALSLLFFVTTVTLSRTSSPQQVLSSTTSSESSSGKIAGLILPHHLLASDLMKQTLSLVDNENIDRIILIGPNHYELGDKPVLTSYSGWNTTSGDVYTDNRLVDSLSHLNLIDVADNIVAQEHSIIGLLPFIKSQFPSATITPIVVKHYLSETDIENLVAVLSTSYRPGTLFITSTDFSHYLKGDQAAINDRLTADLIKSRKYDRILELSNDYVDSPVSLTVLLKIMDRLGYSEEHLFLNTNSGYLTGDMSSPSTSYITYFFTRP